MGTFAKRICRFLNFNREVGRKAQGPGWFGYMGVVHVSGFKAETEPGTKNNVGNGTARLSSVRPSGAARALEA